MILKREFYELLPWAAWLRQRAALQWARVSGGMARQLGVREDAAVPLTGEGPTSFPRAIPVPATAAGSREELLMAEALCPTGAFFSDDNSRRTFLRRQRCVACGLCYEVARTSLAPGPADGTAFPPGQDELTEFPWA